MAEKKAPPTQPSLVGEKVYLRPATADDIVSTHRWFMLSEPQSQTCHPIAIRSAADAVESFRKKEHSADEASFMIVRTADNVPVGRVNYFALNSLNRSAEIGVLVDPDQRQHGYAKEAIRILANFLFLHRGLNKVYAQTSAPNIGAVKLLESSGWKRDAVLRRHYYLKGEFCDGYIYSRLAFERD